MVIDFGDGHIKFGENNKIEKEKKKKKIFLVENPSEFVVIVMVENWNFQIDFSVLPINRRVCVFKCFVQ